MSNDEIATDYAALFSASITIIGVTGGVGFILENWGVFDAIKPFQTIVGGIFGFGALLAGALYNAHLNRVRDDRIRREERDALTAAIIAELGSAQLRFAIYREHIVQNLWRERQNLLPGARITNKQANYSVDMANSSIYEIMPLLEIYKSNLNKLGLLGKHTSLIVGNYEWMERIIAVNKTSPINVYFNFVLPLRLVDKQISETLEDLENNKSGG